LGMVYLGAFAGFNVGWGNVFSIGIAQNVAQIPQFSGLWVRVLFHAVNLLLTYAFVALYARKVKRDPTKSLVYEEGAPLPEENGTEEAELRSMTWRQLCCALITVVGFGAIVWGSVSWGWGVPDYSAVFLGMALLIGLVGGLGVDGTADAFVKGCATLIVGAFVIGMSRAISVVMVDGKIIDTIVHYLSEPISHYGPIVGANLMFYANTIINFFVNSGSGQAVVVMPLMVPLADLAGITRQVAVQAFQFGDGFSNCLYPTSGILMSALALAGIPYQKYLKWFLPLLLLQTVLASVALTILQAIGWN
ncbi:MAG: TIGR00366 family protein, partial [Fretibacterium sp.]|nr:TIGR00366 family protein [Fretibacterium sp.]